MKTLESIPRLTVSELRGMLERHEPVIVHVDRHNRAVTTAPLRSVRE